jgi:hypothetical protein
MKGVDLSDIIDGRRRFSLVGDLGMAQTFGLIRGHLGNKAY